MFCPSSLRLASFPLLLGAFKRNPLLPKYTPTDVAGGFGLTQINANFSDISTAMEDTLSRSGATPNQMEADLDLNSNQLLNIGGLFLVGDIDLNNNKVVNLAPGVIGTDAINKAQAETIATEKAIELLGSTSSTISRLTIPSVAAMTLLSDVQIGDILETTGYSAPGDGGGARYKAVASGTGVPDGGSFIDIPGSSLQAKAIFVGGRVTAQMFNVKGDGSTDDAAALQAAGDFGLPVYVIPGKSYRVDSAVTGIFFTDGPVTVTGTGSITIKNVITETLNPGAPRSIIQYGTATSVKVRDTRFPMGGFRFHGNYRKTNVPVFNAASHESSISTASDLAFGMSSVVLENWYAVFACADDGDANVTFRVAPFLRVESVAVDVVTLRKAGENVHSSAPQTYTWSDDALNGVECLIITETVDGRPVAFSGRETTITDSTTTTVTLADIGSVAVGDWLLAAPTDEFKHYRYCGSFYVDTAEVRNIADSGSIVKSRGIFDQSGTNTGSVPTLEERQPSGHISPLATGVYFLSTGVLSTSSTGQYTEAYAIDGGNHDVSTFDMTKVTTGSQSFNTGERYVPFSFGPQYFYRNSGGLAPARINGQQNIWGWIEP